eukprot:m51a1_g1413 putative pleckstrin domain-containing protein (724) ;mRNA; r:22212-25965
MADDPPQQSSPSGNLADKVMQLEGMVSSMKAWLGQEIAKSAALQIERDAAVKELERQRAQSQAAAAAAAASAASASASATATSSAKAAGAGAGAAAEVGAMKRLRNELVQTQLQFELVQERHKEEKARRAELEGERDRLAAELASLRAGGGGAGQRGALEALLEQPSPSGSPSASGTGALGGAATPGSAHRCSPENPCQATIELRAQLRLQQSEYEDVKGRMVAYGDSIARERRLYEERMGAANQRLEEARRMLEQVREPAPAGSELAELREFRKARQRKMMEEARMDWAREKQELLRQIDLLRKAPGSFAPCTTPSRVSSSQAVDDVTASEDVTESEEPSSEWDAIEPTNVEEAQLEALKSVLHEFVQTEDKYVKSLKLVEDLFMKPMEQLPDHVISKSARACVFSTFEVIHQASEEILLRLKQGEQNGFDDTELGQIFADIGELTKVHMHYAQNYENAVVMIAEFTMVPAFSAWLDRQHSRSACKGFWIESFLLLPIQRMSEYATQLTIVMDCIEGRRKDQRMVGAQEKFRKVAPQLNERRRDCESVYKVVEISRKLRNSPMLVQQRRRFVYEGPATVLDEKLREHSRHFYLFSDIVVQARKDRHASRHERVASGTPADDGSYKYKYVSMIQLHGLKIKDIADAEGPKPNLFQIQSGGDVLVLSCPSVDAKTDWIMRLRLGIEQLTKTERAKAQHLLQLPGYQIASQGDILETLCHSEYGT